MPGRLTVVAAADDNVVLYAIGHSMLGALIRAVSSEVFCQWALLSVQITRHHLTI